VSTVATTAPERVTVALIPKVAVDLRRLQATTGLSGTDIANRAISLYAFLDAQMAAGRRLLLESDGERFAVEMR
jgi:hypothetical protein